MLFLKNSLDSLRIENKVLFRLRFSKLLLLIKSFVAFKYFFDLKFAIINLSNFGYPPNISSPPTPSMATLTPSFFIF